MHGQRSWLCAQRAAVSVQGLMSQEDWDAASSAAMKLFAFGQQEAAKRGLLLVDTKYEFGKAQDGQVLLIDEIHTPDSSRYWLADSYEERHAAGEVRHVDRSLLSSMQSWTRCRCGKRVVSGSKHHLQLKMFGMLLALGSWFLRPPDDGPCCAGATEY